MVTLDSLHLDMAARIMGEITRIFKLAANARFPPCITKRI